MLRAKRAIVSKSGSVINKLILGSAALCGLAVSATGYASAQQAQAPVVEQKPVHPEFPAGDGRDTTLRLCTKCHSPTVILATGRDREGWEAIISKMVSMGAVGTDEDFTQIADYLTTSFPPVAVAKININKATNLEIASALGISADEAKAVTNYKDKAGNFKSLDDLKKVPGIDPRNLDARKDRILY